MTIIDLIQILSTIATFITLLLTYLNLREIKKQNFEQNRGNIIFTMERLRDDLLYTLVIKNYGNSVAKLLEMEILPELDWKKTEAKLPKEFDITKSKNILLAPNKYVLSSFDFRNYPDDHFVIKLKYETCGKIIHEKYEIDSNYDNYVISVGPSKVDGETGLKEINKSIRQLTDKFL